MEPLSQALERYLAQLPGTDRRGTATVYLHENPGRCLGWEEDATIHGDNADWCRTMWLRQSSPAWLITREEGDGPREVVVCAGQAREVGQIEDPERRLRAYHDAWEDNRRRGVYWERDPYGLAIGRVMVRGSQQIERVERAWPTGLSSDPTQTQPVYSFRGARQVIQKARQLLLPSRTSG